MSGAGAQQVRGGNVRRVAANAKDPNATNKARLEFSSEGILCCAPPLDGVKSAVADLRRGRRHVRKEARLGEWV